MSFGEEQSPLILQMSENDSIWAKNKFGYKFKFCTDCFKEITILHKWAFREIGKYPKTFFSSKSRRSFSKERLCSIDTYHWSILRNIEKPVYKKPRSFEYKIIILRKNHQVFFNLANFNKEINFEKKSQFWRKGQYFLHIFSKWE